MIELSTQLERVEDRSYMIMGNFPLSHSTIGAVSKRHILSLDSNREQINQ